MLYEFCPFYVLVKSDKKLDGVLPPQQESYFHIQLPVREWQGHSYWHSRPAIYIFYISK